MDDQFFYKGRVLTSEQNEGVDPFYETPLLLQDLQIEILNGDLKGELLDLQHADTGSARPRDYEVNDLVLVYGYPVSTGEVEYVVADYVRGPSISVLFALFVLVVLGVTRFQGLRALLGMVGSFAILFFVLIPMLLSGGDPILSTLLAILLMVPVLFYFTHGFSRKTTVAVVSTLATLFVTGALAWLFTDLANVSGLGTEDAFFLNLDTGGQLSFRGLFMAGILLGTLGVLDDVTISQASVVKELVKANSKLGFKDLFNRAMNVGRDHIASVVNTLILVYTGASLPLLLFFSLGTTELFVIFNYEFMAEEIVRTLIGSIGLTLAVPITTVMAAFAYKKTES